MEMLYHAALVIIVLMGLGTLATTLRQAGPYGRHMTPGQRFTMKARPAWLLFESPQWFSFALTFWLVAPPLAGPSGVMLFLFGLWQAHYVYRGLIYPWRMRDTHRQFPLIAVVMGFLFNLLNGFANAYAVGHADHLMTADWFTDPRFMAGLAIAVAGWLVNFQADTILINLRADGFTSYRIPHGGAFRWVSAANYFGEIVWWCGVGLMLWTLAGAVFVFFTLANLMPRALAHHRWYREHFPDYPKSRRAVIPGLL
ncbi:3-oxo-5-alpha-steroid 4-dehydrogenase [Zavarzinia aquatilis]|uniref:3-oxo-5-alpha-steroid 4-dehydrogenase n=1 Tax=Zavarzinia aquatilis TaxID=2211142 RepID=A0A317E654_9PROT|nr:3-oxo-5-alpha-steroid 4-dehydrogenase [Zavarzinia aquatilis]PWR22497.1 3-oxo-5-alpha-steroid 4-dehydrogenase [Zavarzinia aquatilis]